MKYLFNNSDDNFAAALNYDGTNYFNNPITFEIDGKLFIVPFGTADGKTVVIREHLVYIVGENRGLDYIGLVCIDLSTDTTQDLFFDSNDLQDEQSDLYEILDKETDEQIRIMSQWL
jgi:hypothetical protein